MNYRLALLQPQRAQRKRWVESGTIESMGCCCFDQLNQAQTKNIPQSINRDFNQ